MRTQVGFDLGPLGVREIGRIPAAFRLVLGLSALAVRVPEYLICVPSIPRNLGIDPKPGFRSPPHSIHAAQASVAVMRPDATASLASCQDDREGCGNDRQQPVDTSANATGPTFRHAVETTRWVRHHGPIARPDWSARTSNHPIPCAFHEAV
jgi:hypothetical protein